MTTAPHPDLERLTRYVLGQLSWSEVEEVEGHARDCPDCQSRLGGLEGQSDSFVFCLRSAGTEPIDDTGLDVLMSEARALTQSTIDPAPGTVPERVAGHELRGELARGGLGVVYLAYHSELRALRAIKRPQARGGEMSELLLARFRREVQAVGALRDSHVIIAHDAGRDADGPFLVMEYLEGKSLNGLVERLGMLPARQACELIRQAAFGLQAGHERGLVHRDVKPSNLMLARGGPDAVRVVVIDWGLVKWVGAEPEGGQETELTSPGAMMGTLDYMAPEQARDAGAVDIRADVYSLGATLYCLLAGKPPFHGRPRIGKMTAHQHEPFPPLERVRGDLPPGLTAVLARMVEKDPRRRFATPGEAADALRPFCCAARDLLPLLEPAPRPIPVPVPRPRRRRAIWLAVAAAVLLAAAVPLGLALRPKSPLDHTGTGNGGPALVTPSDAPVSMSGHTGYCGSLVFLPDGLHAVSECGGGGVFVWDLKNHQLGTRLLHGLEQPERGQDYSGVVAASPDGRYLVAAPALPPWNYMNVLSLYDQTSLKPVEKAFAAFTNMGRAVAFSPGEPALLATEELPGIFLTPQPRVHLFEVPSGKAWKNSFSCPSPVRCFAFSPDGKYLAVAANEPTLRLRDLANERQVREFRGHTKPADQIAFSRDGKRLFSASGEDGTLRVWDNDGAGEVVEKATVVTEMRSPSKMTCVALGPGGRALTGHEDGKVMLWDLTAGAELKRFTLAGSRVTAVAISPDGRSGVAALANHLVYLYGLPPAGKP